MSCPAASGIREKTAPRVLLRIGSLQMARLVTRSVSAPGNVAGLLHFHIPQTWPGLDEGSPGSMDREHHPRNR